MEGQNKDGVWKNVEKLVEFIWFSCVFILLAVIERACGSLQGSYFKIELMTLAPVTYIRFGLCIDNNDSQMTSVGHKVYLCPS